MEVLYVTPFQGWIHVLLLIPGRCPGMLARNGGVYHALSGLHFRPPLACLAVQSNQCSSGAPSAARIIRGSSFVVFRCRGDN